MKVGSDLLKKKSGASIGGKRKTMENESLDKSEGSAALGKKRYSGRLLKLSEKKDL